MGAASVTAADNAASRQLLAEMREARGRPEKRTMLPLSLLIFAEAIANVARRDSRNQERHAAKPE
jgi:hypothetical protein